MSYLRDMNALTDRFADITHAQESRSNINKDIHQGLSSSLELLRQEIERMGAELAKVRSELNTKTWDLTVAKGEIKIQANTIEFSQQALQKATTDADMRIKEKDRIIISLQRNLKNGDAVIQWRNDEIHRLQDQLCKSETECQNTKRDHKDDLCRAKYQQEGQVRETNSLKEAVARLENMLQDMQSERDDALEKLEKSEEIDMELESERDDALEKLEEAEETTVELESERDDALEKREHLQKTMGDFLAAQGKKFSAIQAGKDKEIRDLQKKKEKQAVDKAYLKDQNALFEAVVSTYREYVEKTITRKECLDLQAKALDLYLAYYQETY